MKRKILVGLSGLVGAILVVTLAVSGSRAVSAVGGKTVLGQLVELLKLTKELSDSPAGLEVDSGPALGANFTVDDTQTANFNNLALMTDPTTSGNNNYNNFVIERMSLVDQSNSSTPLSIKNTWGIPLVASDLTIFGTGAGSTTLFWYAGTSTVSAIGNSLATSSIQATLVSGRALGNTTPNATVMITSNLASSTAAGTDHATILIQPNEYLLVHCRSNDAYGSCLRSNSGFNDIRVSVHLVGIATSTPQY